MYSILSIDTDRSGVVTYWHHLLKLCSVRTGMIWCVMHHNPLCTQHQQREVINLTKQGKGFPRSHSDCTLNTGGVPGENSPPPRAQRPPHSLRHVLGSCLTKTSKCNGNWFSSFWVKTDKQPNGNWNITSLGKYIPLKVPRCLSRYLSAGGFSELGPLAPPKQG